MVPVVSDLTRAPVGSRLRVCADEKNLGLPLPRGQSVVLSNVTFLPPDAEHRASVSGALLRVGGVGRRDGVLLREGSGALAVRLGSEWRLGWRVAGYHPERKAWYWIDVRRPGTLMPLYHVDVAVGIGRHLFVRAAAPRGSRE